MPALSEVIDYFTSLSNWGRWGQGDQRGTLNLITPTAVRAALAVVRDGQRISCARTIGPLGRGAGNMLHFMQSSGEAAPTQGFSGATDWFGLAPHGHSVTHLDAPSHIFWNGHLYNGAEARQVTASRGALAGSVEVAGQGVIARGILADIPRHRRIDKLEGPAAITADELDACLAAEGIAARSADVLLLRTGRDAGARRSEETGPSGSNPGLHAQCLPWLREHDVSMVLADVPQEVQPSGYEGLPYPVHAVGLVAMGLWLVDNAYLEELAAACAESARWEFLLTMAPLKLKNSTASPVNPIAVL